MGTSQGASAANGFEAMNKRIEKRIETGLRSTLLLSTILASGLWVGHALAADAAGAQPAASGSGMEEIVVTAQKRSEDITKVPLSVSVLTASALSEQHIQDYQDITRTIPGISFAAGSSVSGTLIGPGSANIVIRGVSSSSGSA